MVQVHDIVAVMHDCTLYICCGLGFHGDRTSEAGDIDSSLPFGHLSDFQWFVGNFTWNKSKVGLLLHVPVRPPPCQLNTNFTQWFPLFQKYYMRIVVWLAPKVTNGLALVQLE